MSAQQSLDDLYKEADKVREAANQTLAQARQDLQDALDERTSKLYGKTNSLVLDGAISQYYTSMEVYSQALEEFDKVDSLPEDNPARNQVWIQLTDASKNTYVKRAQLNELLSYPDELQVKIADATIEVAEAFFNKAEQEHNESSEGPDPDELALAKATLTAAELQLESAQKMVDDLQLQAPMDGVLVTNDLVVGEFYLAGASPAVVVADFSYWQLETTDVTELNINQIKVGESVEIKIDSIPNLELSGRVTKIDAIGVENQGDITYTVTIDLDQQDERLRWNMTGVVIFQIE
jgi:multidrug resistance efflux pump